jgi:hypothetical protein
LASPNKVRAFVSATSKAADHASPTGSSFRRFAVGLMIFVAVPPLLLASLVVLVDPYYAFGSPNFSGINTVRPLYEDHVLVAKPYQVRRTKPDAIILGSSRAEVGLDPRHPGWAGKKVFNFGLPSATSYEVMLALLCAQAGQSPKQAVVGLDFFAYNIFFPRNQDYLEARFSGDGVEAFADFLASELAKRRQGTNSTAGPKAGQTKPPPVRPAAFAEPEQDSVAVENWNEVEYLRIHPDVAAAVRKGIFASGYHHSLVARRAEGRATGTPPRRAEDRATGTPPPDWNEALYLRIHPDIAAAVSNGTFVNGYHHYLAAGKFERREGGFIPREWNDLRYRQVNLEVDYEIAQGRLLNGYHHYLIAGRAEGRIGGFLPDGWNEARYLQNNPAARIRLALGEYSDGYAHYAAAGQRQGLPGGIPAADPPDNLRARWPQFGTAAFQASELFRLVFSTSAVNDALATLRRQSDPASFDDQGMRIWDSHDDVLRALGGVGHIFRTNLPGQQWDLWLMRPRYTYCFNNPDTGISAFDAFRFMLRRAYQQHTDLRLFMTPLHSSVRHLLIALGLGTRYEFWQKELVHINEEEAARAGQKPYPLWDFSDANSVTREAIPAEADLTPMRWFWEFSHYRKAAGDLILDRVLGYNSPERILPADFGVRLTGENIDAHLAQSSAGITNWAAANSDFAGRIFAATRDPKAHNRQAEATCW